MKLQNQLLDSKFAHSEVLGKNFGKIMQGNDEITKVDREHG